MRRLVRLVPVLLLSLAHASPGSAQYTREWNELCGGTAFTFCATVHAEVTATDFTLRVLNLSGLYGSSAAAVFTSFILYDLPTRAGGYGLGTAAMTAPRTGGAPLEWESFAGPGDDQLWAEAPFTFGDPESAIASDCGAALLDPTFNYWMSEAAGCGAAADAFVVLEFLNPFGLFDLSNAQLAVTAFDVSDPGLPFDLGDTGGGLYPGFDFQPVGTAVVPEPVSMALLGTGLLGVGAVRRRRRREGAA